MLRAGSRFSQSARALASSRLARTKTDFTQSLVEPLASAQACGLEAPETQRQLLEFTNGIYVGATTSNSPLTTINIVVKAGSRYETAEEQGVSHFLRRIAYKSTEKHTAVYMTCLPQWYGFQLKCTGTKDAIVYSGSCLKDDADHLLDVMCQAVASPKIYNWEIRYHPAEPSVQTPRLIDAHVRVTEDVAGMRQSKLASLYDDVQSRAFRGGLHRSVFCPTHRIRGIDEHDVAAYHKRRFVGHNIGVFGAGIHPEDLVTTVTRHGLYNVPKGDATMLKGAGDSKFTSGNGEIRHESADNTVSAVLVGQGSGLSTENTHFASLLLQRILSSSPVMDFGEDSSRLANATRKAIGGRMASAQAINVNYSDTGLFGLQVEAGREDIRAALKASVAEFTLASANITERELTAAKAALRADLLATSETHSGILEDMAFQTMYRGGKYLLPDKVSERVNAIALKDVKTFAQSVVNSKHILAQSGDLRDAPYIDELGL